MDRLNELTEGNADSIRELVDLFLNQTTRQLAQLEAAVRANKADERPPRGAQLRGRERHAGHDAVRAAAP